MIPIFPQELPTQGFTSYGIAPNRYNRTDRQQLRQPPNLPK